MKIKENLKATGANILEAAHFFAFAPYILPTVKRIGREVREDKSPPQFNITHNIGYPLGAVVGFALDYVQALGYIYAVRNDHYEVLAIPVATNIISALYEKSRRTKENSNKSNAKTLDSVVEEKKNEN